MPGEAQPDCPGWTTGWIEITAPPIQLQHLQFNFWHWRFINSFTYLLTYLLTVLFFCICGQKFIKLSTRVREWLHFATPFSDWRCFVDFWRY